MNEAIKFLYHRTVEELKLVYQEQRALDIKIKELEKTLAQAQTLMLRAQELEELV